MKTFDSNPWSVQEILSGVAHCSIELPEFQRDFVWDPEITKDLIISISQEHPVGTLLFCKGTPIPSRPVEERDGNESKRHADYLILDGQQRITSLYMILKGEIPPYYTEKEIIQDTRNLHVNVETLELEYYIKQKMGNNPLWVNLTDIFKKEIKLDSSSN